MEATKSLWIRWDTVVTKVVYDVFEAVGWEHIRHPSTLTKDLPLVGTPTGVVTVILGYLAIVLGTLFWRSVSADKSKATGDKKADPAWLKSFILLHNIFLVSLSTFMFAGTIYQAFRS